MAGQADEVRIDALFARLVDLGASDLHIKCDEPPVYRVDGQLLRAKTKPLTDEQVRSLVEEWLGAERVAELHKVGNLDIGHEFGTGRVRVAVYMQRGRVSLTARLVKAEVPSLAELHLPQQVGRLIDYNQGLVLVCGVTGSGKSTTLACLIDHLNETRARHVLTFEDPIEFVHQDKKCIINQRELGIDMQAWAEAIRAGLRSDPDVMLVGEMRDEATFQLGLTAAETGHLVLSTMHTSSAAGTLGRILDLFPQERHELIRQSLAFNLRAVMCQRLVPAIDEKIGRVPAVELMFVTPPVRKMILDNDDSRLNELIDDGIDEGMISWTKSFMHLIDGGFVERRVAREHAPNKEALEMAIRGILHST